MTVSLIVAMARNAVIGNEGDLPWRLSADLRRFKQLTMGHAVIMGRKTYESIARRLPQQLLPGRTSIVITRQEDYAAAPGAIVTGSMGEALEAVAGDPEAFIIGGAQIYRAALPLVDRIYITEVQANVDGDTAFPAWDRSQWELIEQSDHAADERNSYDYSFRVYQRRSRMPDPQQ